MSRLIVKNLPHGLKEERLRTLFSSKGTLTDCSLKFTKSGKFRKFAFIGYRTSEEAAEAIKHFDKTFLDTARIQVEYCKDFGDVKKPRAWSKYSVDSSAYQEKSKDVNKEEQKSKKKGKKKKDDVLEDLLGELKDDPKFEEFLEVHQRSGQKSIWDNDAATKMGPKEPGSNPEQDTSIIEEQSDDSDDGDDENEEQEEMENDSLNVKDAKTKVASKKDVSDLEYLKSKVSDKVLLSSESEESSEEDDQEEKEESRQTEEARKTKETAGTELSAGTSNQGQKCVLKMRGLPVHANEKSIKEFFNPIQVVGVRIPRNPKKKPIGIAYVDFGSEKDLNQAMGRNKNFIRDKRIFLKKCDSESGEVSEETGIKHQQEFNTPADEQNEADETITESGRIFVRNLAYTCTEEDLEDMFGKFGPLTDVHLPIDPLTKKLKGFALITYMIPEHAVKAFTSLDGTIFMGRMLHLMAAKTKTEERTQSSEGSSYKTEKKAKQKAQSGSSHNWNSLFLGANAVADVMADKYNTEKSHILDTETKQSLGVRMALGETQIVSETRDFLLENGVELDSFSQASGPRSKTVILTKNLPSGTKPDELRELFSNYGNVERVILPPSGVTAVVEFLEPTEAKKAFTNLAYTKFQHLPLYLEWAPMNILKSKTEVEKEKEREKDRQKMEEAGSSDESEGDDVQENTTLFVKNLNFDTEEESLREKFEKCGDIRTCSIARKKDMKKPGQFLSMGYGFIEFRKPESAMKALKELQHSDLDGHQLELKISNRSTVKTNVTSKKRQKEKKQKTTKILVRNIPFEAKKHEVYELFKVFGELKTVRLPKKMSGGEGSAHRGFAFVDFLTRHDAKRAFEALCHSTHLYGRRLVLEWAEGAEDLDELRKKTAEHYHEDGPKKKLRKTAIIEQLQTSKMDL